MTSGFSDARAREWVAATPHRWPRWVLVALWVTAFAVSISTGTEPCTVEEPCGPDLTFSLSMVACFGAVVLLWWRPLVAVGCAVAFGILEVVFDPVLVSKAGWIVVAAAFGAYAVHLLSCTARQREVAAHVSVPLPPWPTGPHRSVRLDGAHLLMRAAAVGLVVVAAGAFYGYDRAVGLDEEHVDRSRVVEAVVLSDEDDEGYQKVRLESRPEGFPAVVDVYLLDVPEVGDAVSLRVDPQDPSWTHEIAEPPDQTWWVTIGVGALLIAGLLVERLVGLSVRRRVLGQAHHATGVPVRVFVDGLDFVGLLSTDSTRGLAEFPVDEVLRLDTPKGRQVAAPAEVYLVGDIRHGGWAALASPAGLRLPLGPLMSLGEAAEIDMDSFERDPEDPLDWTDAVSLGTVPVSLPVVVEGSLSRRLLGLGAALAAVVGGCALLWDDDIGLGGLPVVLAAGSFLHWGLSAVADRVRVTATSFELSTLFSRSESPMEAVKDVRIDDEAAFVIFRDESVLDIVPPDGDHRGLAAAIQRAAESAPRLPAGSASQSHLPWTAFAFGTGAVALISTWLMHWLG